LLRTSSTIGVEFVHHFRGRVQLEGGFLHIHDARDIGFLYELHQLHGTATFASGQPIQLQLAAAPQQAGPTQIEVSGDIAPLAPELNLHLITHHLGLAELALYPMIQDQAAVDSGTIDLDLHVRGRSPQWSQMLAALQVQGRLGVEGVDGRVGRLDLPLKGFSGNVRLVAGQLASTT